MDGEPVITAAVNWLMGEENLDPAWEIGDAGERFEGKMNAKVGPVRATFTGQVTLTDVNAPESYVLVGEGKGGNPYATDANLTANSMASGMVSDAGPR